MDTSIASKAADLIAAAAKRPAIAGACIVGAMVAIAAVFAFVTPGQEETFGLVKSSEESAPADAQGQCIGEQEEKPEVDGPDGADGAMPEDADATPLIYVHVAGAVRSPGVYSLMEGSRVESAVAAAGGFSEDADADAVNLARRVGDGEQIIVPTHEQVEAAGGLRFEIEDSGLAGASGSGLVNINTADAAALQTLPGVGEVTAAQIVAYREANGPFSTVESLMDVDGIGEKKFERLSGSICV